MDNQNPQQVTPIQESRAATSANISPTPLPTPKRRSKIIYVLIALFVVIFLGSTVTFGMKYFNDTKESIVVVPPQSPTVTQDPTANWKTYENTQFGYQLKYDDNSNSLNEFSAEKSQVPLSEEQYWTTSISLCKESECQVAPASLGITVSDNPNNLSLKDWLTESSRRPFANDPSFDCINADSRTKIFDSNFNNYVTKEYQFNVDEQTVKLYKDGKCSNPPLEGGGIFSVKYIEIAEKIFKVYMHYYNDTEKEELDQILSTFKFTN